MQEHRHYEITEVPVKIGETSTTGSCVELFENNIRVDSYMYFDRESAVQKGVSWETLGHSQLLID